MTGLAHNQVLKKILYNPNHVDLLIVNNIESFLTTKQALSHINNRQNGSAEDSKRYWLKKLANKEIGLTIVPNGIIRFVEPFSQADKAGIMKGQKIVRINDVDVRTKQNREILGMIKENEKYLILDTVQIYDTQNASPSVSRKLTEQNGKSFPDRNSLLVETTKQRASKENRKQLEQHSNYYTQR